ncbi:hypothetical protein L873DRAFT_1804256 [Choiromyces venosus 120613-1]|uniref:Uncharacterized protein n=1 Tax=Choiromyces venosus 120613-1 TaxID=1336337 RepID=A0A3N4JV91_9PEZI|nr:hypothetical protein L873DRAFT_1804256 [Choiromyces venosus 120613-1]
MHTGLDSTTAQQSFFNRFTKATAVLKTKQNGSQVPPNFRYTSALVIISTNVRALRLQKSLTIIGKFDRLLPR